jgi:hypothetical protein
MTPGQPIRLSRGHLPLRLPQPHRGRSDSAACAKDRVRGTVSTVCLSPTSAAHCSTLNRLPLTLVSSQVRRRRGDERLRGDRQSAEEGHGVPQATRPAPGPVTRSGGRRSSRRPGGRRSRLAGALGPHARRLSIRCRSATARIRRLRPPARGWRRAAAASGACPSCSRSQPPAIPAAWRTP